jgi:hypothetical protein
MIHCGVCVSGWYGAGATLKHRQPARSATCYPQKILRYASRAAGGSRGERNGLHEGTFQHPTPKGGVRFFRIDPLDRDTTDFLHCQVMNSALSLYMTWTFRANVMESNTKSSQRFWWPKDAWISGGVCTQCRVLGGVDDCQRPDCPRPACYVAPVNVVCRHCHRLCHHGQRHCNGCGQAP